METPKLHITLTERLEWICNILPDSHPSKLKKKLSTAIHQNNILISFVSVTLMEILEAHGNSYLEQHVYEVVRHLQERVLCDPHTLVLALMYFKRFQQLSHHHVDLEKLKNYFSVCVMLSVKMNEDRFFKNKVYHERFQFENFTLKEFNDLERHVISTLEYILNIEYEQMIQFVKMNSQHLSMEIKNSIRSQNQNAKRIV
jgi:hypothetical protein